MKTKFTFGFILIFFGIHSVFAQTVFTDDFSGTLSNWTDEYGSNWSIINNELHGFYTIGCGSLDCPQADLILKDQYQLSGDWRASIDFIRIADDQYPNYSQAIADFSLWLNSNKKISISVGVDGNNWSGTKDSIYFWADEWNGNWIHAPVSAGKVKFNWDADQWHTASIEKRGNIYSVFVDNACIGHYIDTLLYGQGKIGLHTYGTKRYDNFKLEPIICSQLFADNFSGTLAAWTDMYGGNWSIQNNELHGFYSLSEGSISNHQADLVLNDQNQISGNWKVSIDFIRIADDQFPNFYQAIADFSLWLNSNNKISIGVGGDGNNWGGTMQDSIYFWAKVWNGTWNYVSASSSKVKFRWNPNQWHRASIEKRGNIYSVFVDDACIAHYIDTFLNGQGKIGLHTYGTKRYDNFTLNQCGSSTSNVLIDGYIRDASNNPIPNVTVTFSNVIPGIVTTDNTGYYTKTVPTGYSGVATPSRSLYTFTPTNRTYSTITVNQPNQDYTGSSSICTPPWQPVQNQQYNMSVIANLYISDVLTTNPADAIGAFVGQECRGIAYPEPAQNGIVFLTITSNVQSGETITFKTWKSQQCEECPVYETLPFVNQSEVGTMNDPYSFHCGMVELCNTFGAGYTWFSVNVNPGSMSLNTLFSNLTPCENDRIIGQQSFATYYGTQWVGSLAAIDPNAMYKMKLCSQQTWCKAGLPAPVVPITLASGYPWIGYLPQSDLPINTALANIVPAPVSNDRFNGQTSFATHTGSQWVGSLSTLQKGKGYIIHLANSSVLTYPNTQGNSAEVVADPPAVMGSPIGDRPKTNPRYNMQMIATIILPGGSASVNAGDAVYAYVGDECRGLANPVPGLDGRLFLSVGSDMESGETITFKVYRSEENQMYDINNTLGFTSEMETGTMQNPYLFNLSGLTGIPVVRNQQGIKACEIYPNPFNATASLEFTIDKPGKVEARIINGVGNLTLVVLDKDLEPGTHLLKLNGEVLPAGLYNLLLTFSNGQSRSVISKKMVIQ
ncbi:MAG: hypothetical protein WCI71_10395 [Bacteroidota bacterium]